MTKKKNKSGKFCLYLKTDNFGNRYCDHRDNTDIGKNSKMCSKVFCPLEFKKRK